MRLDAPGGIGGGAPSLKQSNDPELVRNKVINGGGGMPAFGKVLSEKQINDVVAYITQVVAK